MKPQRIAFDSGIFDVPPIPTDEYVADNEKNGSSICEESSVLQTPIFRQPSDCHHNGARNNSMFVRPETAYSNLDISNWELNATTAVDKNPHLILLSESPVNLQENTHNLPVKQTRRIVQKGEQSDILRKIGFPQQKLKTQQDFQRIRKELKKQYETEYKELFESLGANKIFPKRPKSSAGVRSGSASFYQKYTEGYSVISKASAKKGDKLNLGESKSRNNMGDSTYGVSTAAFTELSRNRSRISTAQSGSRIRRNTSIMSGLQSQANPTLLGRHPSNDPRSGNRSAMITSQEDIPSLKQTDNRPKSSCAGGVRKGIKRAKTMFSKDTKSYDRKPTISVVPKGGIKFITKEPKSAGVKVQDLIKDTAKLSSITTAAANEATVLAPTVSLPVKTLTYDQRNQNILDQKQFKQYYDICAEVTERILRIVEELCQYANPSLQQRNKFINDWRDVCENIRDLKNFDVHYTSLKVLADVLMEYKDFQSATDQYHYLKVYSEDSRRYKEKLQLYHQLGLCYRLQKLHKQALKYFKKQLELAWEQQDHGMELNSYAAMSIEYYNLGDFERARYYEERMMRGKVESDDSVVKCVSNNLLLNRREVHHEKSLKKQRGEEVKNQVKNRQLPSPKSMSKSDGTSKSVNLLPFFSEYQESTGKVRKTVKQMIREQEQDKLDKEWQDKYGEMSDDDYEKQKATKRVVGGPNFYVKDLQHMNQPPKYEYLKKQEAYDKKSQFKKRKAPTNRQSKPSVPRISSHESSRIQKFNDDKFAQLVKQVVQQKEIGSGSKNYTRLTHHSLLRTFSINTVTQSVLTESVKKYIKVLLNQIRKFLLAEAKKLNIDFDGFKRDQLTTGNAFSKFNFN